MPVFIFEGVIIAFLKGPKMPVGLRPTRIPAQTPRECLNPLKTTSKHPNKPLTLGSDSSQGRNQGPFTRWPHSESVISVARVNSAGSHFLSFK